LSALNDINSQNPQVFKNCFVTYFGCNLLEFSHATQLKQIATNKSPETSELIIDLTPDKVKASLESVGITL